MPLLLIIITLVHAAVACTSPRDCSYNGHCDTSSACVCSPQWTGPRCETLNLLPARKDGGFRSPHAAPEHTSSWGGSILYDESDGLWHMFAAEMANGCGINHWEPNSRVVHATAAAADGPYAYRSTVLEPFAHEPNAVRAPDGTWVIYMTLRHPNGQLANCSESFESSETHRWARDDGPPPRHTYMVHAPSPNGPWSEPQLVLKANTSIWNNRTVLIDTNLAVAILPDSSVVGIWRKCENPAGTVCEHQCCTFPHLLTASNWRNASTYTPHSERRLLPEIRPYGAEDPMLWLQPRAPVAAEGPAGPPVVHAILHDEQGPQRCTAAGRHAFSDDLGATWSYAEHDAYNGTVEWAAGGGSSVVYRRERPHMVVGARGEPRFLSNGVQESTSSDRSWTLVQPIRTGALDVDAGTLLEV